jgi:hypothetical protein
MNVVTILQHGSAENHQEIQHRLAKQQAGANTKSYA